MSATVLAELLAAGVTVEAAGDRVRLREPRPGLLRPGHAPAIRVLKPALYLLAVGAWRQDLAAWPGWRRFLYEERAAIREHDGRQARDLAERCAYLEAAEAPEPQDDPDEQGEWPPMAPPPRHAMPPEVFPGTRVEVRQRSTDPVTDSKELRGDPEEAPPGFQHQYRPPPERPARAPFRWSTPPPTTRRPAPPAPPPHVAAPTKAIESPDEPRAGAVHGPLELPERRAARFGYRIDAFGSWLEPGEASRAPHLPRFALGREPSKAEQEAQRAQLDVIEADCIARLGP